MDRGEALAKIGYARVSTAMQSTDAQVDRLKDYGCSTIFKENISGGETDRPELERAIRSLTKGDKLVVIKFDRLARSLPDLIRTVHRIEEAGAFFESVTDTIDCSTPLGRFFLHILGAVAEFERGLVHDRTIAGLKNARAKGRVGGNPRLRRGDPEALASLQNARDSAYFTRISAQATYWLAVVRERRPETPWEDVLRIVNFGLARDGHKPWTVEKLRRAASRFVSDGLLDPNVMKRAKSTSPNESALQVIAGIVNQAPFLTYEEICRELARVRLPTPRGNDRWRVSSVKNYIEKARDRGMIRSINRT
tara:strand:+ start:7738 stop:8661 length:924 start_codon:yes stop_codon:yes gene_type:complete